MDDFRAGYTDTEAVEIAINFSGGKDLVFTPGQTYTFGYAKRIDLKQTARVTAVGATLRGGLFNLPGNFRWQGGTFVETERSGVEPIMLATKDNVKVYGVAATFAKAYVFGAFRAMRGARVNACVMTVNGARSVWGVEGASDVAIIGGDYTATVDGDDMIGVSCSLGNVHGLYCYDLDATRFLSIAGLNTHSAAYTVERVRIADCRAVNVRRSIQIKPGGGTSGLGGGTVRDVQVSRISIEDLGGVYYKNAVFIHACEDSGIPGIVQGVQITDLTANAREVDDGYTEGHITIYAEGDHSLVEDVYIGDCIINTPDGQTGLIPAYGITVYGLTGNPTFRSLTFVNITGGPCGQGIAIKSPVANLAQTGIQIR